MYTPTDSDAIGLIRISISWLKQLRNTNCWFWRQTSLLTKRIIDDGIHDSVTLKLDTSSDRPAKADTELTD